MHDEKDDSASQPSHGGARPGAGRPKEVEGRQTKSFELGADQVETIEALADAKGWSKSKALRHIVGAFHES